MKNLGYLTSQQALADYVDLIEYFKSDPRMKNSPVIAFGGSYGGMLSAWFRMKYPHIVQGYVIKKKKKNNKHTHHTLNNF